MSIKNTDSLSKNIWSLVGKTISIYIPEFPLLKRDEFGFYTQKQFQEDHPVGLERVREIYDDEEVIFEQWFHFRVMYCKCMPLENIHDLLWVFPDSKVEVDFVSNKNYYKGKDLFIDHILLIGSTENDVYAELKTTSDACDYSYSIGCDFFVEGNLLCSMGNHLLPVE